MKKKLMMLFVLFVLALSMCACGSKGDDIDEEETEIEEVKEKEEKKEKEEPTPTPEPEEEPTPTPEPVEIVDPEYTDEFVKAGKYEDYASKTATPSDTMVWIEGVIDRYEEGSKSLILKSDDGDWEISLGKSGTDNFYDRAKGFVGLNTRVFGKYTGYSEDLEMPTVSFTPKEFSNHAYRMETLDNSSRLTQVDYLLNADKLSADKDYDSISFKIAIEWREVEHDDTLFYYLNDETISFIMIHSEEKKEAEFEGMDDDKILLEYANEYMKNTKVITKEPTKIKGYPALLLVTTYESDDTGVPMSLYSYLIMVDDDYYYVGYVEPYLTGDTGRDAITDLVGTIRKNESADASSEKKDDTKTADDSNKDADNKTDTDSKKDSDKTKEEEKTVKTGIPPLADLAGLYDVTMTITRPDGTSDTETLKDSYFGMNELSAYNESNGTMTLDLGGGLMASLTFSYNSKGKVVFSGLMSDGVNAGTVSGVQTKSAN